jgi:hypothetical protein
MAVVVVAKAFTLGFELASVALGKGRRKLPRRAGGISAFETPANRELSPKLGNCVKLGYLGESEVSEVRRGVRGPPR